MERKLHNATILPYHYCPEDGYFANTKIKFKICTYSKCSNPIGSVELKSSMEMQCLYLGCLQSILMNTGED